MLAPHPPRALLTVRAIVVIFPISCKICNWECLSDGSGLAQSIAQGRDEERNCMQHVTLGRKTKVPLALFLGLVIGFGTQDPFSYLVICHCLGFDNCTKLNLFIIRK